jgi:ribonuclease HII
VPARNTCSSKKTGKLTSHKIKPTFQEERILIAAGYHFIAGLDEVGRGCFAGPVVASAVILPYPCRKSWIKEVRDSKFLLPVKREYLCEKIKEAAVSYATGIVGPEVIDAQGISVAVRLAMVQALNQLSTPADSLLIDHFKLPESDLPQWGVVNGDTLCCSIACASIVAKVTRDRLMVALDKQYPGYSFSHHKGYGTTEHRACIEKMGLSPLHRRSFCLAEEESLVSNEE